MLIETMGKALSLMTSREKRRGFLVLIMAVAMALAGAAGIASLIPFLTVLSDPGAIDANEKLSRVYSGLGFKSHSSFTLALGFFSFFMVVFSSGFRLLTIYAINRYTQLRKYSIGRRLLETYLRQPYAFFLGRSSSDMAKGILLEVDQLVSNVIKPALDVASNAILALAIVLLLVLQDPWLALVVAGVIGGSYVLIYSLVARRMRALGRARVETNRQRFAATSEVLSGIKDIKLLAREQVYLQRFSRPSNLNARYQASADTLGEMPRYLVEAIGFGGVIALSLYLVARQPGMASVLPVLGIYVFAGYKLLPAAQKIYSGMTKLRFGAAVVDHIHNDMRERELLQEMPSFSLERMQVRESLSLEDVGYSYPSASMKALDGVSLHISRGQSVGLVGRTGSGKTTLVDIVLGLLEPAMGCIRVDGVQLGWGNIRSWQRAVGYVPQSIFIADGTVAENVALGIPGERIDMRRVEKCCRLAQLHEFVVDQLPGGYLESVGERGVRLSGGQRQRLGIARALYLEPDVLVLDEATSALDSVTEREVMAAIAKAGEGRIVIIIAHRLSTIESCDFIVHLDKGRIKDRGTYGDLYSRDEGFRGLAGADRNG